jgi:ATP-dependent Clp protease ATP-binding subunit ClpC
MFERFTDGARRVVVLAQEEARHREHPYIGTEHLLLAVISDEAGIEVQVLTQMGVSAEAVRARVDEEVPRAEGRASGHLPFSPYAKQALELSLLESAEMGDDHIGPRHLLLGLMGAHGGVAARILADLGADIGAARQQVALVAEERWEHPDARIVLSNHNAVLVDVTLEALAAVWDGDLERLQAQLSEAVRVAARADDRRRLELLSQFVVIDDPQEGRIRLRPRPDTPS